jgi:lipopolysaccharide/colanic/teichoic acid biosynthesis glycosyltransferase
MMAKRATDIIISSLALIILAPLLPLIALILRLTGEGEIFYIQPRIGKEGREFGLVKFATMLKDSPNLPGGDVTLADDPRVLPVGRFLRKTKLNELTQLWNVLKGDMSLVGPRPLVPAGFASYPAAIREEIETMQPGLTGIGSIVFRDEECLVANVKKPALDCYYEDILPYKGQLEIWYKKNRSLSLDLTLIVLTAWSIFFPANRCCERLFKNLPERPDILHFASLEKSSAASEYPGY